MRDWKVTAVITTYKRKWASIVRAIESVLNQTRPVYELLLVDDNNADSPYSEDIQREVAGLEKVRYVPMVKNGGVAAARNRGIAEAKGDLIAFLDDDDEWAPEKVAVQVSLFEKDPDLGIAFVTGRVINEDTGEEYHNWQYEIFKENPSYNDMLYTDYVGSASVPMIRLAALRDVGGFIRENQPAVEDYELWIRVARKYAVKGVKDVLFIKHTDSNEHVSGSLVKVGRGFRNIYALNRQDYQKDLRAHVAILWNICRCGVRGKDASVIPYVFRWFFLKVLATLRGVKA
ncbi:MAG: glycosyltransferase [Clostridia bacterium]|nr:glycosyltransferase [Clostridia bacterium]